MKRVTKSRDKHIRNTFMVLDTESITEQFVLRQLWDLIELLDSYIADSVGKNKTEFTKRRKMAVEVMHMYRLMHHEGAI